jgi:hypothetical protein
MSECRRVEKPMQRLVGEEIRPEELEGLLDHVERCSSCEELFELHHDLSDPRFNLSEPEQEELLGVRRAVLREIRTARPRARAGWFGALPRIGSLRPALAVGLGVLLLAAGYLAGRDASERSLPGREALVSGIDRAARVGAAKGELVASPYVYSNVRLRDAGGGRVDLSFDVATRVDLVRRRDDPLVSEIVVQAMLQDEALGTRLKAVSHADRTLDVRVKDALILAMLGDPDLPVRLKALTKLASGPTDSDVETAMLEVVGYDESVQMRLLAIDFLAETRVRPELLTQAIDAGPPDQRYVVYARALTYIEDERERSER